MLTEDFIRKESKSPEEYILSIGEQYNSRWDKKLNQVTFTSDQLDFLKSNRLPINIFIISAEWCPDCQAAVPILIEMARQSDFINLFILEKDDYIDQFDGYEVNGGIRVPFVQFLNNKFQELDRWVERSSYGYDVFHQAKQKAIEQETTDYKSLKRELFAKNSKQLFAENIRELFNRLKRASNMRAASASLDELKPKAKPHVN